MIELGFDVGLVHMAELGPVTRLITAASFPVVRRIQSK